MAHNVLEKQATVLSPWRWLYWPSLFLGLGCAYAIVMLWPYLVEQRLRLRYTVGLMILTALALGGLGVATPPVLRRQGKQRFLFAHLVLALVTGVCLLVLRVGLDQVIPPWPNCDLRPIVPLDFSARKTPGARPGVLDFYPWFSTPMNSWGQRDLERSFPRVPGVNRIVFIGDSFLEGVMCRYPLPLLTELKWRGESSEPIECVNLGVSSTGPVHYYHRLEQVGRLLHPDAVFLFLYAGNDFLHPEDAYHPDRANRLTAWVRERPLPSLLGELSPRTTWWIVNRFHLSEYGRGVKEVAHEFDDLYRMAQQPFAVGVHQLSEHIQRHHHPEWSVEQIETVLRRGGSGFWKELATRTQDPEFLQGWLVSAMLRCELTPPPGWTPPKVPPESEVGPWVAATHSWIEAIHTRCTQLGFPLVVFLAPTAAGDPHYVEYWRPWPGFLYRSCTLPLARHVLLVRRLQESGISCVDLAPVLRGIPHTYRLTDGHWTEAGHDLVSERVLQEIRTLDPGKKNHPPQQGDTK